MCGIAGIVSYRNSAPPVDAAELLRIRDAMRSRGPDGAGVWIAEDERGGLAHRRLAIIDVSDAGAQPMEDVRGRLRIVFNGEIYNYRALRADLERRGYRFKSQSDTEVLLNLYAERGAEMLHVLRGMYAFAIWDAADTRLFLARDPFGIKPLYYADDGGTLRFASQTKALLAGGALDREPDCAGNVGFMLWGTVPEPYTLFKRIRALPPGSYMTVDREGAPHLACACDIVAELAAPATRPAIEPPAGERRERLTAALADSVEHHLVADVPVGLFLSSGLDSSTLVATASCLKLAGQLRTLTLGFPELRGTPDDETVLAREIADRYGTLHQTRWITRVDFEAERSRFFETMDQPSIDGVNSYFVSRAAAACGLKVALSGLGGDEIFGGYSSFREIPMLAMLRPIPRAAGVAWRRISAPVLKRFTSPKYASLLEYGGSYAGAYLLRRGMFMPWELPEVLDGEMVRDGWAELQPLLRMEQVLRHRLTARTKVSALEMTGYMRNQLLRDADWAGMAHSLEIRVPLIDLQFLRDLVPLINSGRPSTKLDLARTASLPLPEAILNRAKTGFLVPVREWMQESAGASRPDRGLRKWARVVHSIYNSTLPPQVARPT